MAQFKPHAFGEYYLLERVAVGGMAEIYKAKTYGVGGFEKLLAIKKILPHHAQNQEFIHMLIDEAKIAVALNHVNIVQVYDLGKIDEDYFIAMEFVEGRDLRSVIKRLKPAGKQLSVENAVFIILEICKGLDYAHRKTDKAGVPLQVVHRDISPQNILITFEGEVKIVDFGIAKAANKVTETDAGVLKGKFSYMSPEQAAGDEVDRRADIFSTGIILYELLTGEKLFPGQNHHAILQKIRDTRIEPPFLPADVPSELEYILAHALSYDVNERYQFASEFQIELSKFLYSNSLDFTARNLSQLMRQTFQDEIDSEKNKTVVDVELDDSTRSGMQGSHSQSLVSKSHSATERADSPSQVTDAVSPEAKNRTIIHKFKNILQKDTRAATGQTPPPVPASVLPPAPGARGGADVNEHTELLSEGGGARPRPAPTEPAVSRANSDVTPPTTARDYLTYLFEFVNALPPAHKLAYLLLLSGLLAGLITLVVFLSSRHQTSDVPAPGAEIPAASVPAPPAPNQVSFSGVDMNPGQAIEGAAKLILQSTPSGARVLNERNQVLGQTPLELQNVAPGTRLELTFTLENHQTLDRVFVLEAGQSLAEQLALEPLYGSIEVNSSPPSARVFLNEEYIGQTPLNYDKVPPRRTIVLSLKLDGYEEYTVPFQVPASGARVFNKTLEKAFTSLLIRSVPSGARVIINMRERGQTPLELTDLNPGASYLMVLRAPGYQDWVQYVEATSGSQQTVAPRLRARNDRQGAAFLETVPSGATILLNGKPLKTKTPAFLDTLRTDTTYNVQFSLPNYQPEDLRLQVSSDQVTFRRANLKKQQGRLSVRTQPIGAQVYINDKMIGRTPVTRYALDAGQTYQLTFRYEGYQEQSQPLEIQTGDDKTLELTLKPLTPPPATTNPR